MFARGPIPGATPKNDALSVHPGAVCKQRVAMRIRGYVVFDRNGNPLSSAGTAQEAWRKAAAVPPERTDAASTPSEETK